LADAADPQLRDAKRAVELASEAVELDPRLALAWQYLGWVQYRSGNWRVSLEALEKSCGLQKGGDCCQWIVMSLAHGKLAAEKGLPEEERTRHETEARRFYEQTIKQLNPKGPGGTSIIQATRAFRAEAAELLRVNENEK
jgi:hypothetical protein